MNVTTGIFDGLNESDRGQLGDAIQQLLDHGSILWEDRNRELYQWVEMNAQLVTDFCHLLGLEFVVDRDNRLFQAWPKGERFVRKLKLDESVILLLLWFLYDQAIREEGVLYVTKYVFELNDQMQIHFDKINGKLSPSRLKEILSFFNRKNLVRIGVHPQYDKSQITILPTIRRVISFENLEQWMQTCESVKEAPKEIVDGDTEGEPYDQ